MESTKIIKLDYDFFKTRLNKELRMYGFHKIGGVNTKGRFINDVFSIIVGFYGGLEDHYDIIIDKDELVRMTMNFNKVKRSTEISNIKKLFKEEVYTVLRDDHGYKGEKIFIVTEENKDQIRIKMNKKFSNLVLLSDDK